MFDASCGCGQRIGWAGRLTDRPACPKCGHCPSQAELAAAAARLEAALNRPAAHQQEGDQLRQSRVTAGLGLRQAASLLGVTASRLSWIESGVFEASAGERFRMNQVYELGEGAGGSGA